MEWISGLWHDNTWLRVLVILSIAFVVSKFGIHLLRQIVKSVVHHDKFKTEREERQRIETILATTSTLMKIGVWAIAALFILGEIGVNLTPLIAGAGVAGLVLGIGAQSLIKDFLVGFFVLTENQYRIGDVVKINDTISGTVEHISLRETVLRDMDGRVHHIPNGTITLSTNMTMEYSGINLDIGVAYNTDIDKLEALINKVGQEMADDEKWGKKIVEQPEFLRIDDFADSAIIVKITGQTKPMKQWEVKGELRRRLKKAFDKAGIEIPYPQVVMHKTDK